MIEVTYLGMSPPAIRQWCFYPSEEAAQGGWGADDHEADR